MLNLKPTLAILALLGTLAPGASAQELEKTPVKTPAQDPKAIPPPPPDMPKDQPPPPPAVPPRPPSESFQGQQKTDATGQWVYTEQYGWVWMPYGDRYTHLPPDGSPPNMYVYYPENGWCWVVAPWLWGWGPMPYFGVAGPRFYAWFGIGLGRWHGFAGPYVHWGHAGRAYWGGGRWVGVERFYGGPRGGGFFRGGRGLPRDLGPGWRR